MRGYSDLRGLADRQRASQDLLVRRLPSSFNESHQSSAHLSAVAFSLFILRGDYSRQDALVIRTWASSSQSSSAAEHFSHATRAPQNEKSTDIHKLRESSPSLQEQVDEELVLTLRSIPVLICRNCFKICDNASSRVRPETLASNGTPMITMQYCVQPRMLE